ncbi:MAG: allantoicase [Halioglobus sp.]
MSDSNENYWRNYTDLVSERVGGRALACSDEWFAECENLVKQSDPIFRQGHFVATGQWMDGWESRRSFGRHGRDESGVDHDWCMLRLGIPGIINGVDIETTHFTGNAPEYASLEGAWVEGSLSQHIEWFELHPKSVTTADAHNVFTVSSRQPCTHIRLKIFPDGGVARLRAWGSAKLLRENYVEGELVDLVSVMVGGRGQQCSDEFYSSPSNLLMPGQGSNMGDGWETRRRRDADHDWCIIKFGVPGSIRKVILDTAHFKGNYPESFSLEATYAESMDVQPEELSWQTVIAETPLRADQVHLYIKQILAKPEQEFTHVRLNIFPDGGLSRLRIFGSPDWEAAR